MVLGEINGRAFGINKYLSVMDFKITNCLISDNIYKYKVKIHTCY